MVWTPEMRRKYALSREQKLANEQRAYAANPEKWARVRAIYYARHKVKTLHRNWIRQIGQLGCTPEMYDLMMEEQKGLCAICNRVNVAGKKLAVDHCHATGHVRGLLCNRCNAGLGAFDDDLTQLKKALEYLCRGTR